LGRKSDSVYRRCKFPYGSGKIDFLSGTSLFLEFVKGDFLSVKGENTVIYFSEKLKPFGR
jgi:hypothetical protein